MFQCLDKTDGDKLQTILNASNDVLQQEHRLVCTFRLPKGKRPSRIREDIKVDKHLASFSLTNVDF